ncbi:hypothetical protein FOZ61_010238 [Perkinsus olseni]|uniref:Uncharacterized protein n=1 Tax=Perkinsus olseni TaxID=32597 RepID=A0A7J6L1S5_PEROL|nr:hypothetical protein FOZ61_010238 [Perkinsus olseni]KAF4653380.1 hypothetical protein FOL46_009224 [Perkinsus olseni]
MDYEKMIGRTALTVENNDEFLGMSMLEHYGSVQPLPARVWQQSEFINATLDREDVPALVLFLLPLWRSVLASSDSTVTKEILEQLRRRSAKFGGVPVYLREAMVDKCANLSGCRVCNKDDVDELDDIEDPPEPYAGSLKVEPGSLLSLEDDDPSELTWNVAVRGDDN